MHRRLHLVAYDIRAPRRLRQALQVVRDYALGGQKSAHECFLTEAERTELLHRLEDIIAADEDRLFLLRLDPRATTYTLGKATAPADPAWFYLG